MKAFVERYKNLDSFQSAKLDQLIQLGIDLNEDVLGQLIAVHNESSLQILEDLKKSFLENDYEVIKRCAHKFKSSTANLGLLKLNQLCIDLENYLKNKNNSNLLVCPAIESIRIKQYIDFIDSECRHTNALLQNFSKAG